MQVAIVIIVALLTLGFICVRASWGRVWLLGSGVALVRVGVLWFLIYREWTHQQSLETLPLVLLLYPEGLLLPASVI